MRKVVRTLFEYFPKIDIHDHYRQGSLAFHQKWPTKTWWHRLYSNLLGMLVVDAYFIYLHEWKKFTSGDTTFDSLTFPMFIDRLAYEMIHNTEGIEHEMAPQVIIGGGGVATSNEDSQQASTIKKPVIISYWLFP